ncbi:prolyl aminopeptidase [Plasmopara halstedii]|uniref:Proline iminopeptidase n=1 Tax=Plasmopara halstedii TaxID=4781 RepID=A0A0P1AJ36_PLAHL|nr:prolyl aminopeptidase [Plasmopara halstedii]CEG40862.1 prolyl aminopeptidase [Plasmopara halstedii]|eukprot:XP_024577231.1 prolyl aminopeptidase [Plasmopara halstedii]
MMLRCVRAKTLHIRDIHVPTSHHKYKHFTILSNGNKHGQARRAALGLSAVALTSFASYSTFTFLEADKVKQLDEPQYLSNGEKFLYPMIQPFNTGMLQVSPIHQLYYEECGNPYGKPVIIIHGGPGAGCSNNMRRYHDPRVYRIILFDQRGSGRSKPHASLQENTTWHLVEDIEKLRCHFNLTKWQVFGGSWGSTLSITYAITHPTRVTELILRGIFHVRDEEIAFYYQHGANFLYPDRWEAFRDAIPESERGNLLMAYHKRLTSKDPKIRLPAALAWTRWEKSTSNLIPPSNGINNDEKFAEAFACIENHYFVNKGFFPTRNFLNENVEKIRHIPTVIVQGRYDVVCPMKTAWEFHKAFPESDLRIVQTAGHSAMEPGIAKELVDATNKFKDL